jgi:hypothetical protein
MNKRILKNLNGLIRLEKFLSKLNKTSAEVMNEKIEGNYIIGNKCVFDIIEKISEEINDSMGESFLEDINYFIYEINYGIDNTSYVIHNGDKFLIDSVESFYNYLEKVYTKEELNGFFHFEKVLEKIRVSIKGKLHQNKTRARTLEKAFLKYDNYIMKKIDSKISKILKEII